MKMIQVSLNLETGEQKFEVFFARRMVGYVSTFKDGFTYKTIFGDTPSVYFKSRNIAANEMIKRHRSDFTPIKSGGKWESNIELNKLKRKGLQGDITYI